jgi:hypothetical protein
MEQEINIKLHIVFLNPQWKDKDSELQDELLNLFSEAIDYDVSYLESSCKDNKFILRFIQILKNYCRGVRK